MLIIFKQKSLYVVGVGGINVFIVLQYSLTIITDVGTSGVCIVIPADNLRKDIF
jgi:hypothetical protein